LIESPTPKNRCATETQSQTIQTESTSSPSQTTYKNQHKQAAPTGSLSGMSPLYHHLQPLPSNKLTQINDYKGFNRLTVSPISYTTTRQLTSATLLR